MMSSDTRDDDVDALVDLAWEARIPVARAEPEERASWLESAATALESSGEQLIALAASETAMDPARLRAEVARTAGQARLFGRALREGGLREVIVDRARPDAVPIPTADLRRDLVPLGPIAVFPAGNFPFAFGVFGGDTVSALASGNPVVVKAHPGYPSTSEVTARIVIEAMRSSGAPSGALSLVTGISAGLRLVSAPAIQAVGFTGSFAGGRALQRAIDARVVPIPFYGELGSVNPVFVLPDFVGSVDDLAEGFVGSLTGGDGRLCTKPGVLIVPRGRGIAEEVARRADSVDLVPTLGASVESRFQSELAHLAASPALDVLTADRSAHHAVVFGTTAQELQHDAERVLVEAFGPAAVVVEYADQTELLSLAGTMPPALVASVFTAGTDAQLAALIAVVRDRVGRLVHNGWPTGVAVTWAMHHGGPFPATTAPLHTSVGVTSARRWQRPVVYQGFAQELLPHHLRDGSGTEARIDGRAGVL